MDKIDAMLNKWVYNTIVRKELRELIIKAINRGYDDKHDEDDEMDRSWCCGAKMIDDSDLCPKCLDHGRKEKINN